MMSRRYLRLALLVLAGAVSCLASPPDVSAQVQASRSVEISGHKSGQQFAAGDSVSISAQVADDVFAAGRRVTVDGARMQSLIAAAVRLEIRNSTLHDLIAGGLDVRLDGTVEDDAVIAVCPVCWWGARRVEIGREARIGDEARIAGETIIIDGTIGGSLRAVGRRIVVSGSVDGRADLKAAEIVLTPTARLGGELIARSPARPQIATGAVVAGPVREIPTPVNFPDPDDLPRRFAWFASGMLVVAMLGALLLASLVQLLIPRVVQSAADRLSMQPWSELGLGLATLLLTPLLAMLLVMTVVGIPVAFVLMAGFFVLGAIGFVTICYRIGLWLRRRMSTSTAPPGTGARIGWTLVGAIVVLLLGVVPLLGGVVVLLAVAAGIGAAAAVITERLRAAPPAPLAHADVSADRPSTA